MKAPVSDVMYRAAAWSGVQTLEGSLPDAVEAIAVLCKLEPEACATRQIDEGTWHVYDSHDRLDIDRDGLLWFAKVTLEVAP